MKIFIACRTINETLQNTRCCRSKHTNYGKHKFVSHAPNTNTHTDTTETKKKNKKNITKGKLKNLIDDDTKHQYIGRKNQEKKKRENQ